ncbi:MAG: hypothetical protein CMK89_22315 [Pseudomonadales bacterium]|nr:hypothetical protein [Pseudomonadales bacterium]
MKTQTKTVEMKSGDSFYFVQKDNAPGSKIAKEILSESAINEEIVEHWLEEIQAEEPEAYIVKTVLFRGGEVTVHVPAI